MSELEATLALHIRAHKLAEPEREYRFAKPRRWRFDFAWPQEKIAAECEGGTWINGGHSRGKGFEKDAFKYNVAALMGWQVFRFTTDMVKSGEAVAMLQDAFNGAGELPDRLRKAGM